MSFRLAWDNPETSVATTVYRSTAPIEPAALPEPLAILDEGVAEFIDSDLLPWTRYYYRLASNRTLIGIESAISDQVALGYDGVSSSLDLDFAAGSYSVIEDQAGAVVSKAFADLVTFTRASGGGRFNELGQYEWLPNERTNLMLYSESFSEASWSNFQVSINPDEGIAPGGGNADEVLATSTSGIHALRQSQSFTSGKPYVLSFYAKPSGLTWCYLQLPSAQFGVNIAYFDIENGAIGQVTSGSYATIKPVEDGWYFCTVTRTATATGTNNVLLGLASGDGGQSFVGNGESGVFAWGAQLEAGVRSPHTYIPTTTAPVTVTANTPRFDHDPVTLEPKGLLVEPARTNLLTQSQNASDAVWTKERVTVSGVADIGIDGARTTYKITEDSTTNSHRLRQNVTVAAGTTYTMTVVCKPAGRSKLRLFFGGANLSADFDLSGLSVIGTSGMVADIEQISNGWIRISATGTQTAAGATLHLIALLDDAGNFSYAGDGSSGIIIDSAQLEVGSFPTSYIPTEGSAVTRATDNVNRALGSEFNPADGTVLVEVGSAPLDGTVGLFSLNLDASNFVEIAVTERRFYIRKRVAGANVVIGSIGPTFPVGQVPKRVALAYKDGLASVYAGGALIASGLNASPEGVGVTEFRPGRVFTFGDIRLGGQIARAEYYPRAMTTSELQALTAP